MCARARQRAPEAERVTFGALRDARAGFRDASRDFGLAYSGNLPIESMLNRPPAVLLEPDPTARVATLRRRVLAKAGYRVAEARFPRSLINCGGPTIVAAMARLAAIRRSVVG